MKEFDIKTFEEFTHIKVLDKKLDVHNATGIATGAREEPGNYIQNWDLIQ